MSSWLAELAWTGSQLESRLLLEESGGRLTGVRSLGSGAAPPEARLLPGLTLPGLASAHSHCFHRALRGRTEQLQVQAGDFWGWRRRMYALAERLDPESYHQLARATLGEMALAGITAVGEFHYLHHRPDGSPYQRPEMEEALVAAAQEAGLRLTLLDTCYLRPGFQGGELEGGARRFGDRDALDWARRASLLQETPTLRLGAAIHSVRAVDQAGMRVVSDWARERQAPLHLHLSEQTAENRDCLAATGMTPTRLLASAGVLGPRTTAVHAIHLTPEDIAELGSSRTLICVCPTTERELGDGVCPGAELSRAGSPLCLGSDSNAVVDIFEEARALELDQRLATQRRGLHAPEQLLQAATAVGMRSLGWEAGELREGLLADFLTLETQSPRLGGPATQDLIPRVVFAAGPEDVRTVVVGGREIVHQGRHLQLGNVGWELERVLRQLEPDPGGDDLSR